MKKLRNLYICLFLLTATITMDSCLRGKGDVVSQTFEVESFSGICNGIDADIHITKSPVQSVEIVAQPNITKNISLEVTDGILNIKFKKKANHYEDININISMPELRSLAICGTGNINTTNAFDSCGTVLIDISGSGNINASFNSNSNTYTKISGSGNISLTGDSPYHDMTIEGEGNIYSFGFHTDHSVARIIGSGSCELTADSTLNVLISGSGNIYYKGHPVITSSITGEGAIHDSN